MQNMESKEVKQLKEEVTRLKEKNAKIGDDFLGLRHSYQISKKSMRKRQKHTKGWLENTKQKEIIHIELSRICMQPIRS